MAPVYLRSTISPRVPFTWCLVTVVGVLCFKSDGGFSRRFVLRVLSWYGASFSCHIASGAAAQSSDDRIRYSNADQDVTMCP
ncbi:hypothetical protein F2Q70_00040647 [Brassica cretica]|uniref:Uncharacterized protein n=1 Tax=Brassica cretica TaxID=69181 RepID=A0A8S9K3J0_BRACR|nr:hypothetical protein F2Q70_00040647 [Brassica cretica]